MTRNQKIGIGVAAVLVIVLLIWLYWPRGEEQVVPPAVVVPEAEEEAVSEPEPAPEMVEEQAEREQSADLATLAKTFTERYGSYSTQADFANLQDVMIMMTSALAQETQAYIDTAQVGERYYGVTTNWINMDVEVLDEEAGQARVMVHTQREEAYDSPQNITVKYQDLLLEFEKISGSWKVSSAQWQ